MKAAVCGSFDPPTLGHIDIIERASRLFDELIVFIACNSEKNALFSMEQRKEWLMESTKAFSNVKIRLQKGLIVEACQKEGVQVLVRGIRNESDCSYEQNIAYVNHCLDPSIETLCLFTKPEYMYYSSSNVRELLRYQQDIQAFVPSCVYEKLKKEST